ncbi:MFS transporter [Actinacidiphila acididurans]|uniref:MFS transporter n=1 Tax=Actinacidiphila acididurans TaxID=2784346 RepID=A0ABS2TSP4_9ACTN|nr:MFS transporter [Actinacidiphila acididurans]MBM9506357.1 MFS transporter [Actinacidiphila acididurans]
MSISPSASSSPSPAAPAAPPRAAAERRPAPGTFAILAAAVSAYALLQSLVVPVLATIQQAMHTNQSAATWVLTAYLLSASIFTPIIGRIGDAVGKKQMLVVTLAALAVGLLLAAVAGNIGVLIIARVLQGIGGGVLPLAFGITRDEFPPHKAPATVGVLAALTAVGGGLGIVLAGPIINALDYHWLFWLPLIAVVITGLAAQFFLHTSPVRSGGRISVTPAVLLSVWLVCLLLALSQASDWGWGSARVIGLLVAGVLLAAAWMVSEQRAATPLVDLRMMRQPAVWTTNLVALLVGVGMYATFGFLPQFLQTPSSAGYGFGSSVTASGLIMLPWPLTMFVFGTANGRLTARFGSKALVVAGSAISVPAYVLMTVAHDRVWELCVATGLLGVGLGLAFSAMSSLIVTAVPAHQTGVASGMNANIRTIGGAVGAALMTSIVTAQAGPGGLPKESGYVWGFGALAVATVLAFLAALLIPRTMPGHFSPAASGPAEQPAAVAAHSSAGDASA